MTKQTIKKVINAILKCDLSRQEPLGNVITNVLFKENALYISDSGTCFPMVRGGADVLREFILGLSELVCILDKLKENDAIIAINESSSNIDRLFYSNKENGNFRKTGKPDTYYINSTEILVVESGKCEIRKGDNCLMQGVALNNGLGRKLCDYLSSYVYPTFELQEFAKYRYKFSEQIAIRNSSISIFVAIIIACISPLITLWLGNKKGITKLNEDQLKEITGSILITKTDTTFSANDVIGACDEIDSSSLIIENFVENVK